MKTFSENVRTLTVTQISFEQYFSFCLLHKAELIKNNFYTINYEPYTIGYSKAEVFGAYFGDGKDKEMVGFGFIDKKDKNTAWLFNDYVLETYRGLGIHKKLIAARVGWAKEVIGYSYVGVETSNPVSFKNYEDFFSKESLVELYFSI